MTEFEFNPDIPQKQCRRCGQFKPATKAYFDSHPDNLDGLHSWCRECKKVRRLEKRNEPRQTPPTHYNCRICKTLYPFTDEYFHRAKDNKYGLMYLCKQCNCDKTNTLRVERPELVKERKRQEYQRNKEQYQKTGRKYYSRNQAVVREQARRWRLNNAEQFRYHMRTSQARRRGRKLQLLSTFTAQDWDAALTYWNHLCAYCDRPRDLWYDLTQDHFIPVVSGGHYTPENIVPCCKYCNSSKQAHLPEQWLIERYGKHKASRILKRIQAYFDSIS